ncbi:MAG: histone deacetylase family protein [Candidimonas sp.]
METLYITHPACRLHEMGTWHPECPERLDAINDQLRANGILDLLSQAEPAYATDEDIRRVHDAGYVDELKARQPVNGSYRALDPDTLMNAHTLDAARAAAGAGIAAVDAVMAGSAATAFCAVRPPGHHARRAQAMGFCFFNNVAIAAAYALEKHGLQRVAIVDFDVHHGNGTEEMFTGDPRVMMCSFYQHPFFPNLREEHPAGNMLNTPVPAYTTGARVRRLVDDVWVPRLLAYRPEMICISAGFDAHREDDMGQLDLVESDFAWITAKMVEVADACCGGRIVSLFEGGYNLSALGRSVVAHVRALSKL